MVATEPVANVTMMSDPLGRSLTLGGRFLKLAST